MKSRQPFYTQVPLNIVGSTVFGRYPKISVEETYNMIISDNFLVPFAGHMQVATIAGNVKGRGLFTSVRYNHMIAVIGSTVYSVDVDNNMVPIANINTSLGPVYIDEDNVNNIAICDLQNIYIYNYINGTFVTSNTGFIPGYITYQDARFIAAQTTTSGAAQWRLSEIVDGAVTWPDDSFHVGVFQTKSDNVVAVQRFPGRGNLLFVMGSTVTELWQDIGLQLFPYQRNSSVNVDYGCLSPATIAFNENIIVWLAANEKSGPMIAYSTGGDINKISTDGIDFRLANLTNPSNSYGFLYRQDGHLLYQITFPDDNLTYAYDFNTRKFFTLCNENMQSHIAQKVAYFNDKYYFVSNSDGNLYELNSQFTTYNGVEIPRIRVCRNIRLPDTSRFAINNLSFTIEQGVQDNVFYGEDLLTETGLPIETENFEPIMTNATVTQFTTTPLETELETILLTESGLEIVIQTPKTTPYIIPQAVGLSVSRDGGEQFGNIWTQRLNPRGKFKNRLIYWQLGTANDFIPQFRFWGLGRFVATDGVVSIYQ
jgi:hypothetical protein